MEKPDEKEKTLHDWQKQVNHGRDLILLRIKTFRYFIISALTASKVKTFYKLPNEVSPLICIYLFISCHLAAAAPT